MSSITAEAEATVNHADIIHKSPVEIEGAAVLEEESRKKGFLWLKNFKTH